MVTIEQSYNDWRVKVSFPGTGVRGYSRVVPELADVFLLVKHHHAKPHDRRRCLICKEQREKGK